MTMKDGIQMIALTFRSGTFLGKSDVNFNGERGKKQHLPFDPLTSGYIHPREARTVRTHRLALNRTMLDHTAFPFL